MPFLPWIRPTEAIGEPYKAIFNQLFHCGALPGALGIPGRRQLRGSKESGRKRTKYPTHQFFNSSTRDKRKRPMVVTLSL